MAGAIQKEDIINIAGLDGDVTNAIKSLQGIAEAAKQLGVILGDTKGLKDLTIALKSLNQVQKEFATFQDKVNNIIVKSEKARQSEIDTKTKAVKLDREILNLQKQQEAATTRKTKSVQAEAGSYDDLNAKLNQLIRNYKALTQAQRDDISVGGAMLKQIDLLDSELKQLDATMGRHQRNVGNYKSGFNGLQFSMMQVGRELPSLAYGFSTFIGAISNNIPMVTDEITRARIEIERAKKAGETSTPIWKQLGSAIFSWQTAMVVGLTVLTIYGREIAAWGAGLIKGVSAIDKAKIAQERLNEANKKGYEDGQKDIVRLKLLYNATQSNTQSIEQKRKAIKELQDQYPDYLGKFSEEEILAGRAGKAYYELANAIMASAKAKAYEQIIVENEVKKRDLEIQVLEKKKELANEEAKIAKEQQMFSKMGIEGQQSYAGKIVITQLSVNGLKKDISDLNAEIAATEYSSKELADKIKPTDLLSSLGQENGTSKKVKNKKVKEAKDFTQEILGDEADAQKTLNDLILKADKELTKELNDERKARTNKTISNSLAFTDEEKLIAQETAIEDIKIAKNNKEEIENIQHELTLFMIDQDIAAQQRILDTAFLEPNAYEQASRKLRQLKLQRGEEDIAWAQRTEEQKRAIFNETARATNELLQQGLDFSKQIYSAQAIRAQATYNAEIKAAGDSLEKRTLAERKFEEEDKKIKRRQAVADKLQAVFNAGLNLALAIGDPNLLLKPLKIAAATIGLATALATPIPAYAEGTDSSSSTFVAGEEGSELIRTKSGKLMLTPNKATLFSDPLLAGSTVFSHDTTQNMLASMAMKNTKEIIDMKETNGYLSKIAKNTSSNRETHTNAQGRTVVKRGSVNSIL